MIRLLPSHRAQLSAFLESEVAVNIFLLSTLHRCRDRGDTLATDGVFYALEGEAGLDAVVYTTSGGLCVPFGPPALCRHLGTSLRGSLRPRLLVGPRASTDAFWEGLASGIVPRIFRDHRLYTLRPGELQIEGDARRAAPRDLELTCDFAARMQEEELGIDPRAIDARRFRRRISRLIADGLVWILPKAESHGFQASASAFCPQGTQVEAVYTPVALRGRGFATEGLAGMCAQLLELYPLVTLHVNQRNHGAVALYERLGFFEAAAFRLINC